MKNIMMLLAATIISHESLAQVRVGMVFPADNTDQYTIDQLRDSELADFRVESITPSQASDLAFLANFDVILVGESHDSANQYPAAMFLALKTFLESGKSVITMSYWIYVLGALPAEARAAALDITAVQRSSATPNDGTVAISDIDHPAMAGIANFTVPTDSIVEVATALADDAYVLATVIDRDDRIIAAMRPIGRGRSVYLAPLYHSLHGDFPPLRTGMPDRLLEQIVAWLGDVTGEHHCQSNDALLKCFGANKSGQLGQGHAEDLGDDTGEIESLAPIDLGEGRSVEKHQSGVGFHCALLSLGVVKCWGENKYGQLGIGDTENRGDDADEMGDSLPALDFEGHRATAIALGHSHGCALLENNETRCWGQNRYGQLGLEHQNNIGDEPGEKPEIVNLGTGQNAVAIYAGSHHTCAQLANDRVKCWGRGSNGQLGQGGTEHVGDQPGEMGDSLAPTDLGSNFEAASLSLGTGHSCALAASGRAKCWGSNSDGQLALGDTVDRGDDAGEMGDALPFIKLGRDQHIERLVCRNRHCCATLLQGTMKCWGENYQGQLGYGDQANRGGGDTTVGDELAFVPLRALETVHRLQLGKSSTCIESDRGFYCWGSNHNGELGQGDSVARGGSLVTTPARLEPIPLW